MKQQTSVATETRNKVINKIDYSGKTIFVGIDTHEKDYQVAKVIRGICLGNHRMKAVIKNSFNICGPIIREPLLDVCMKVVHGDLLCNAGSRKQALTVWWCMPQMYQPPIRKEGERLIK